MRLLIGRGMEMSEGKILKGRAITGGEAEGRVLLCKKPLSFLGGVDKITGIITDSECEKKGESVRNRVLVFPYGKGSTVGSYVMYSLKKNGTAPAAIINEETEIIVAVGAVISEIPLVDNIDISQIPDGAVARVDGESGEVIIREIEPEETAGNENE